MKRIRKIINELKNSTDFQGNAENLIREFIFYSPKMPLRLHQEELLSSSKQFQLSVPDTYFTKTELKINCFSWGSGKTKILLTHGWASKAADYDEFIIRLLEIADTEIIAFDAPGNGSSISEFSNLMLYVESVKSISQNYATPDFIIGHSLGAMANVIAIQESGLQPKYLFSIAPLIRLKENFEQSLSSVNIDKHAQDNFFKYFAEEFPVNAEYFNLTDLYTLNGKIKHFVAHDPEDHIAPLVYLKEFLVKNSLVKTKAYQGIGHYKILKSEEVIEDIIRLINSGI